jgi:hypothetical protein
MTARRKWGVPGPILSWAMIFGLLPGVAVAGDAKTDPLGSWSAVEEEDLATLHGREGVVLQVGDQEFEAHSNNTLNANQVNSGIINFRESLGNMHGIFNQLNNTGNNANNQNGLIVNINVH